MVIGIFFSFFLTLKNSTPYFAKIFICSGLYISLIWAYKVFNKFMKGLVGAGINFCVPINEYLRSK